MFREIKIFYVCERGIDQDLLAVRDGSTGIKKRRKHDG